MTHKVFTVYDSKAEAYLQPFVMTTRGQAIRAFTDSCNDPKTSFYRWPADYTLFEIGEWDETKGQYSMLEAKKNLGLASEFIEPKSSDPRQMDAFPTPLKNLNSKSEKPKSLTA